MESPQSLAATVRPKAKVIEWTQAAGEAAGRIPKGDSVHTSLDVASPQQARVVELRSQYQSGSYRVDPPAVSAALIDRHLEH